MPEEQRPRGVTPRPRSGAAAESTRLRLRRNSREELPHTPTPEAKGGGREEQPRPEARGGNERSYPEPWLRGTGGPRGAIPH